MGRRKSRGSKNDLSGLSIRQATAQDAEGLLAYMAAFFAEDCDTVVHPSASPTLEQEREWISRRDGKSGIVFLAERDGKIAGMIDAAVPQAREFMHTCEFGMSVLLEFRRQGIGRELVRRILKWADGRGLGKAELNVFSINLPAIGLYTSMGFAEDGRRENAVGLKSGGFCDLVHMSRYTVATRKSLPTSRAEAAAGRESAIRSLREDSGTCPEQLLPCDAGAGTVLSWRGVESTREAAADAGLREAFASGAETIEDAPKAKQGSGAPGPAGLRRPAGEKYEFRSELGRGGLGRVVEAVDRDFGREIAVKMMLPDRASPEAVERFLLEGRAAGRLSHPNIVPIHEIGVLAQPGQGAWGAVQSVPYFTMTKIMGRDLGKILRAVERGSWESVECRMSSVENQAKPQTEHSTPDTPHTPSRAISDPRKQYTRHRLLGIFQDVCNAIAYAHDHGVIHRDLKPANIMVGDYGEVYVVDWGLAKMVGQSGERSAVSGEGKDFGDVGAGPCARPDAGQPRGVAPTPGLPPAPYPVSHTAHRSQLTASDPPMLTLEGTVMGTPTYMPPEQADGRISEIDERSDIYSLGAILYEILTFHPPFEGDSANEVIYKVLSTEVKPPSVRASELRLAKSGKSIELGESHAQVEAEHAERPAPDAARSSSILDPVPPELDEIVMKALSKNKEKRHATAGELSSDIRLFLEGEKERIRKRQEACRKIEEGHAHAGLFVSCEAEIRRMEKEIKAWTERIEPWMPVDQKRPIWEMQDLVGRLQEEKMEEFGSAEDAFRQSMADDSSNPDGAKGLCNLYLDRYFAAEKQRSMADMAMYLNLLGRHDRSGGYLREIDKTGLLTIRTHSYACRCMKSAFSARGGAHGTDWCVSFGEEPEWPWRDGKPLPGTPLEDGDWPVPRIDLAPGGPKYGHGGDCPRNPVEGAEVRIGKYAEKDRRLVLGELRLLGKTPIVNEELARGSYVCLISLPGFAEVRLPVLIERGGKWKQDVNIHPADDVPEGFCYVPGGRYIAGGTKAGGPEEQWRNLEDFFIGRRPVSFREYAEFLDAISARDVEEARKRQPRESDCRFLAEDHANWGIPAEGERNPLGLTGTMPATGITWFDAMAYCEWLSNRDGRLYTLPHEEELEKAARGVDGRVYPWGDTFDATFSNNVLTHATGPRLREPCSFPSDQSPYGVLDLIGNALSWCWNAPEKPYRHFRCLRGGCAGWEGADSKLGKRHGYDPGYLYRYTGMRLVVRARAFDARS